MPPRVNYRVNFQFPVDTVFQQSNAILESYMENLRRWVLQIRKGRKPAVSPTLHKQTLRLRAQVPMYWKQKRHILDDGIP